MSEQKVWSLVMFDVPTKTKDQVRAYTRLHKELLYLGFNHLQHSVYARYVPFVEPIAGIYKCIKAVCPPGGDIRMIFISDNQWGKQVRIYNEEVENQKIRPSNSRFSS